MSRELIRRQRERVNFSNIDKLIDVLEIKPGMTVLDLGTGSGQYAYKIAEKLNGTGTIFATDIDINMIEYLNQQVKTKNLINLHFYI